MPYLGNAPSAAFQSVAYQDLTGGTGTSFTLSHAVSSAQELEIFVNNVRQEPTVAYTVAGTALTMTGTIAATDDFYVVFQGKAVGSVSHPTTSPLAATTGNFTGNVTSSGTVTATSFSGDGSALTGVSAGKVLQVKSINKTDTQSLSSLTFQDITGLALSITPSSTSSYILAFGTIHIGSSSSGDFGYIRLERDIGGTQTNLVGDTDGARVFCTTAFNYNVQNASALTPANFHYYDSPVTTSQIDYKLTFRSGSGAYAVYINRTHTDRASTNYDWRTVSNLTLMEIEGP